MSNETVNKTGDKQPDPNVLHPTGSEAGSTPKPRKSPVPQQYDRILAGALKLPYAERAMIAQKLNEANKQEVAELQEKLKAMNGTIPNT